ncbi:MAG: hypothetical protein AB7G08_28245 [Hyphomicrobiaceae bacterium]
MTAMWQLATDDIHWVNVVGMHWRGIADYGALSRSSAPRKIKSPRSCFLRARIARVRGPSAGASRRVLGS